MATNAFTIRRTGTTGHEIGDPDGTVIAWAVDEPWAHDIAALLNRVEMEGLASLIGIADLGNGASTKSAWPVGDNVIGSELRAWSSLPNRLALLRTLCGMRPGVTGRVPSGTS